MVETLEGEAALAVMDRMSIAHTGEPFPYRSGVAYLVEPEHVRTAKLGFERSTGAA